MESEPKKVNLILGPGAARGLIHVGAIRALMLNNFQIQSIIGSSMGAIVAWYFAINGNLDNAEEFVKGFYENSPSFIKKYSGLLKIDNSSVKNYMLQHSGNKDLTFGQMKIPLIVIATNVRTGKATFLNSGSVIDAIIASSTIPFINKPYQIGNDFYIDGGFVADPLTHIPASLINDYPYIGINVSNRSKRIKDFSKIESSFLRSSMLQKFYEFKKDISVNSLVKIENIIHIKSDDDNIHSYDFHKALECFNIGEKLIGTNIANIKKFL